MHYLAAKLHHLRSTETCPSIYNSPYHVGFHPTAYGIPVEQHLREAIRPTLKADIRAKQKSLRPIASLPPISPLLKPGITEAMVEEQARQDRWLSKASRMGTQDFIGSVGTRKLPHLPSVHNTVALDGAKARQVSRSDAARCAYPMRSQLWRRHLNVCWHFIWMYLSYSSWFGQ